MPSQTGWLRLRKKLSSYVAGDYGTGAYPGNAQKMVEDAVAVADAAVDFSDYDADGDGYVDNLVVVHAGTGAEYTGSSGDLWSHRWTTSTPVLVDGVYVSTYSMAPEYWQTPGDMTVGVFAHEIGHVLGFRDLYDRDYSSAGVGEWSLMGSGSWNGVNGDSPARLDAWSATRLGWLEPATVTGDPVRRSLASVGASRTGSAVRVVPHGGSGSEYFLIENRQQTGTDAALPGAGLLIWHVDEQVGLEQVNDDETHKLLDLEEAGGVQDLDGSSSSSVSADDPFPGSSEAHAFTDLTTPDAGTYAGAPSSSRPTSSLPPPASSELQTAVTTITTSRWP
jgi:immune inhibitor A